MQFVALLGTACFVVVGAVVGARVLLLARRSRQLPELYLGASLFLYAAIGQPFAVANRPLAAAYGYEARILAVAVALCAITTAMIMLYLFTNRLRQIHQRPVATLTKRAGDSCAPTVWL